MLLLLFYGPKQSCSLPEFKGEDKEINNQKQKKHMLFIVMRALITQFISYYTQNGKINEQISLSSKNIQSLIKAMG